MSTNRAAGMAAAAMLLTLTATLFAPRGGGGFGGGGFGGGMGGGGGGDTGDGTPWRQRVEESIEGTQASDFPPGTFTDGEHYHLSDFQGKVLVLFFFQAEDAMGQDFVTKNVRVFDSYADKPVRFIGVAVGNTMVLANFMHHIGLTYPVFVDNLGAMSQAYDHGMGWYLEGTFGLSIIGPDGRVTQNYYGAKAIDIDKVLKDVHWKYKGDYDKRLDPVVDLLEWNQFDPAMRKLRPLRKSMIKDEADDAVRLYDAVKADGQKWKADAEKMEQDKPTEAYDLYTRLAAMFPGDDLAKAVQEPLARLKATKAVKDELAAREMFERLDSVMPQATQRQRADIVDYLHTISRQYAKTPTGRRSKALADAVSASDPMNWNN